MLSWISSIDEQARSEKGHDFLTNPRSIVLLQQHEDPQCFSLFEPLAKLAYGLASDSTTQNGVFRLVATETGRESSSYLRE
jgi:hypothetical protein